MIKLVVGVADVPCFVVWVVESSLLLLVEEGWDVEGMELAEVACWL